MILIIR